MSTAQLTFDLEALGLVLEPTSAMLRGEQRAFQCSFCGTVVVRPSTYAEVPLGDCPTCRESTHWWAQTFPVAGLRQANPESAVSGREDER